jgi:hypothetical protein
MPMTSTERKRKCRALRRAGMRVYHIAVVEAAVEAAVIEAQLLNPADAGDPAKVEAALWHLRCVGRESDHRPARAPPPGLPLTPEFKP